MYSDNPTYYSKRLRGKLTRLITAQLTLLEAGAGYGKTTAVRETLGDLPHAHWHTAISDDMPGNYAHFCRLIQCIDASAGRALREIGLPNRSNAREIALTLRELDCPSDTYLVMDNFQYFLPGLPEPIVAALVNPTSPRIHIVILSHYLGSIRRLRAESYSAVYIGRDDLLLRRNEVADYFARAGLPPTDAQLRMLYEKNGGWIVSVSLCMQSALESGLDAAQVDMESVLTDLLWNRLTASNQEKLLAYSFFEQLDAAQICEMEGTQSLSNETQLLLGQLPLVRVDDARQRYGLHQLLREYLHTRFDLAPRGQAETAARRAGLWSKAHGDATRAITCFWRIKDYDMILSVDLVNLFLVKIDGVPFEDIAQEIADTAPDTLCSRHPISMLRLAYYLFGACRFDSYSRLMERMGHIINGLGDRTLLGEWTLISAFSDFPDLEKMGLKYQLAASMIQGRSRAVSPLEPYMFGCPSMWMLFYAQSGAMEKTAEVFSRVLPVYSALTGGHGSGADQIYRGECYCVQGRFEDAELCAYKAIHRAEAASQVTISYAAAMLLGIIAVYRNDYTSLQKAIDYLETRASAFPKMQSTPMNTRMLETVRGYLLGLLLETSRYPDWARDSGDANLNLTFVSFMIYQSQVTDLVLRKDFRQAIAKTELLLGCDPRMCSTAARNFMLVGLALCYLAIGRVNKAAEMLDQSLTLAAPDQNYTFISRFKKVFAPLFLHPRLATKHKNSISEIRSFRIDYAGPDEQLIFRNVERADLPDRLTRREREIAQMAADGMRNREIAEKLSISEITVKSHMSTILQKLNIDCRSKIIQLLK